LRNGIVMCGSAFQGCRSNTGRHSLRVRRRLPLRRRATWSTVRVRMQDSVIPSGRTAGRRFSGPQQVRHVYREWICTEITRPLDDGHHKCQKIPRYHPQFAAAEDCGQTFNNQPCNDIDRRQPAATRSSPNSPRTAEVQFDNHHPARATAFSRPATLLNYPILTWRPVRVNGQIGRFVVMLCRGRGWTEKVCARAGFSR